MSRADDLVTALGLLDPDHPIMRAVWQGFTWDFPLPPSVWKLYESIVVPPEDSGRRRSGKRRVRSRQYNDWWNEAGYTNSFPEYHAAPGARFLLDIDLGGLADSGSHGSDCDNRVKAVQDLVAAMIGIDDKRCDLVVARRSHNHDGTRAWVTLVVYQEAEHGGVSTAVA
jgi:hypothetical protein